MSTPPRSSSHLLNIIFLSCVFYYNLIDEKLGLMKKCSIWKKMNWVLCHLSAHIAELRQEKPPEDGEMNEITLPSSTLFEIRALAVRDWACYLSVTETLHNIESLRVNGEETFCFFETWRPEWGSNPRSPTFQALAGSFNHGTKAPAHNAQYTTYSISSLVPYNKINLNSPSI